MFKKILGLFAVIIIASVSIAGIYYLVAVKKEIRFPLSSNVSATSTTTPLTSSKTQDTLLTVNGIFADTNLERVANGQKALKYNDTLAKAAGNKINDMVAKGYFEHISPTGAGPADLAKDVGYEYLTIGENLAMGDFGNDKGLVDAWMASPGHRENILRSTFTEIGIAAFQGMYKGKLTWFAVKEFGRPASDCPAPSASLKQTLDTDKASYDSLSAQAANLQTQVDATTDPEQKNALINQYNALVPQINALKTKIDGESATYNQSVNTYNACIS